MAPPPARLSSVRSLTRLVDVFFLTLISEAYLAAPVLLLFYIIGYVWKRQLPKRASEIDLDVRVTVTRVYVFSLQHSQSGRKSWLTVEEMRAYRAERRNAPTHIKLWRILFSN